MSKLCLLFTVFLFGFALISCGNPTVEDFAGQVGVGGDRPIEPGPPDDDDGGDPPDPPDAKRIIVEVDGHGIGKNELEGLKLPYKKGTVKPVPMGTYTKSKSCPKNYKKKCVKNRQVLVAFDVDGVVKHLDKYYVSDIQFTGDFYSIGKNFRTELICLLHKKSCSGRGIIKLPGWGLPWIAKMAWWEKKFWKDSYENVVKTQNFHHLLESSWDDAEKMYIYRNASLKFNRLFRYNKDDLTSLTAGQNRFVMVVTDDTYLEKAKLIFKLVEKL